MASIKDIIKSRFKSKEDWYYDRMEKCLSCEHWSSNKDKLSTKDITWKVANLGKDFCTICGCPENKLRLEGESCPKGKWLAVDSKGNQSKASLISLTNKIASLYYDKTTGSYTIEYGEKKRTDNTTVELLLEGDNINELKTQTSCGCTESKPVKVNNGYKIAVKYDNRIGSFKKSMTIKYKNSKNELKLIYVYLKGVITN